MEEENIIIKLLIQSVIGLEKPKRYPKNTLIRKYVSNKDGVKYLLYKIYYDRNGKEQLAKMYDKSGELIQYTRMMYPDSNTELRESTDNEERDLWVKVYKNNLLVYEYFSGEELYISYRFKNQINWISKFSAIEKEDKTYYQFYYDDNGKLSNIVEVKNKVEKVKFKIFNQSKTKRQIDYYLNPDWLERTIILTKNKEHELTKKTITTFDLNNKIAYDHLYLYRYYPNKKIKSIDRYSIDINNKQKLLTSKKQFNSEGLQIKSTVFDKNSNTVEVVEIEYDKRN